MYNMFLLQEGHEAELEERDRHVQQLQAESQAKEEQIEAKDDFILQLQNDIASTNRQMEVSDLCELY